MAGGGWGEVVEGFEAVCAERRAGEEERRHGGAEADTEDGLAGGERGEQRGGHEAGEGEGGGLAVEACEEDVGAAVGQDAVGGIGRGIGAIPVALDVGRQAGGGRDFAVERRH